MRKIGLISLALVLALGSLGVGYAMWTDSVNIEGEVTTGSVDVEIIELSSTFVYKILSTHGIVFSPEEIDDPDYLLVASANTSIPDDVNAPLDVRIEFTNLFPTTTANITGDIVLRYIGTVPAHVVLTNVTYTMDAGSTEDLADYLDVEYWYWDYDGVQEWVKIAEGVVPQLHEDDELRVEVCFDLPQENRLMNQSGTISGSILVHQWNEEPE
jgi:predicted ribosomally synthesized peptide with SipW-like signal peptide